MIGIVHIADERNNDIVEWTSRNVNRIRTQSGYAECNAVMAVAGAQFDGFSIEVLAASLRGETTIAQAESIMLIFRGMEFAEIDTDLQGLDRHTGLVLHMLSSSGFDERSLSAVDVIVRKDLGCLVLVLNDGGDIAPKMMECDYINELPLDVNVVLH